MQTGLCDDHFPYAQPIFSLLFCFEEACCELSAPELDCDTGCLLCPQSANNTQKTEADYHGGPDYGQMQRVKLTERNAIGVKTTESTPYGNGHKAGHRVGGGGVSGRPLCSTKHTVHVDTPRNKPFFAKGSQSGTEYTCLWIRPNITYNIPPTECLAPPLSYLCPWSRKLAPGAYNVPCPFVQRTGRWGTGAATPTPTQTLCTELVEKMVGDFRAHLAAGTDSWQKGKQRTIHPQNPGNTRGHSP
jgi:hypothetical protein